jgi:outer membrane protein assembly factor BamA
VNSRGGEGKRAPGGKRGQLLRRAAAVLIALALSTALWAQSASAPPESVPAESALAAQKLSLSSALNDVTGLRVSSIAFRGLNEDEQVRNNLLDSIEQRIDEPLDRSQLQASIRELFATGRFSNIAVDATRGTDQDVALTFYVRENYFIGAVTITGAPKHPTGNQLINASKLQLGEVYDPDKIKNAMASMKSVLADNGWYQAEVRTQQNFNRNTQIVDIHFWVDRKEQARVGDILVPGTPGYSEDEIRSITKLHPGSHVTSQRITKALERLRKKYQKDDRLEAQVSLVDRNYHPDTNRLDYVFSIERGPSVDLRVEGAKVSRGVQKRTIPIFEENAVDDDLLNEGRRNLLDYLQQRGYFDARVEYSKEADPQHDRTHVVYQINRGDRHSLVALNIEGNKYFDRGTILERMSIRPVSGFLTHGRYSETLLSRDIDSIVNLYKANGFRDVNVSHEVQDNVNGRAGDLAVTIHIDEGPQSIVNSLNIVGNHSVSDDDIRANLSSTEGQPYSDANIASDRDSIVNYYFNHGFPDVQFESSTKPVKGDPTRLNVTYTIKEGEQVYVDRVRVAGLSYTRPFIVDRELQIHDNDPLSQSAMLDTQRRLYDLGIFNEVDVAVQNPDGNAKYKDLMLQMSEARRWTITYGLGFEVQAGGAPQSVTELNTSPGPGVSVPRNSTPPTNTTQSPTSPPVFSPRVSLELTRLNFRGRDHTITFRSHLSRLTQLASATYEAPRWFDKPNLQLTFTGLYDNSRDVNTFTAKRLESTLQLSQSVSKVTTLLYRYQFRRVSVDANSLAISPALIPNFSSPVRVGIPSFTYIRDKRDDPIESHKGNYTTFDVGVAAKQFGSETNFSRFLIQNSTYLPFRKRCSGGTCTSWVFARMTRVGVEEPFAEPSTIPSSDLTSTVSLNNPIPLPERFFGGGNNSHRGFALNQAGPRDLTTGFPIGGNAIFVNSFELRTPPPELPWVGNNLSFVLFHDYGNVFDSGQDMLKGLLRFRQPNRDLCRSQATGQQCDFNYSAEAVGIGARYRTPIGPVRFDVSYNMNPPEFGFFVQCAPIPTDSKGQPRVVHGVCGNAQGEVHFPVGTQVFEHGTLTRINVFFSIGQTF